MAARGNRLSAPALADLPHAARERVARYRSLLERYHTTLDLLSPAGFRDLDRHLAEAAGYAATISELCPLGTTAPPPHRRRATIVDLGSGSGLPGIVIAAILPEMRVVLVERRRRRASFLTVATSQLGLPHASVVASDVARVEPTGHDAVCADVVTAQAVADLSGVFAATRHLHRPTTLLVSRKGPAWAHEVRELSGVHHGPTRVRVEPLGESGRLVAIQVSGGQACQPSG